MSATMVFANKFLLNYWDFSYPMLIVSTELFLNALFISLFSYLKLIDKVNFNSLHIVTEDSNGKYFMSAALFYLMHSITSLKALSKMNIPMYVIFKRCVPLVNLFLSAFFFKKNAFNTKTKHSSNIILSIFLMTFGVFVAGIGDISFDPMAYVYCGFSVVCQSLYFTSIQKCSETQKNSFQALFVCCSISLPILIVIVTITGEFDDLIIHQQFKYIKNIRFIGSYLCVVTCGAILCFSQFWCTMSNNAITTSVVGVLKSVVQTALGMVLFDGFMNLNLLTLIGIAINLIFGTWYTYLKYIEHNSK